MIPMLAMFVMMLLFIRCGDDRAALQWAVPTTTGAGSLLVACFAVNAAIHREWSRFAALLLAILILLSFPTLYFMC